MGAGGASSSASKCVGLIRTKPKIIKQSIRTAYPTMVPNGIQWYPMVSKGIQWAAYPMGSVSNGQCIHTQLIARLFFSLTMCTCVVPSCSAVVLTGVGVRGFASGCTCWKGGGGGASSSRGCVSVGRVAVFALAAWVSVWVTKDTSHGCSPKRNQTNRSASA